MPSPLALSSVSDRLWLDPRVGIVARLGHILAERKLHPSHMLVLLPYAQLMPVARAYWAQVYPDGFAPRFETTMACARAVASPAAAGHSIRFDMAHDLLVAQDLLDQAGQREHRQVLAQALVESAHALGRQLAAVPLEGRERWVSTARHTLAQGMEGPALELEAATARVALEWAAVSTYPTDGLLGGQSNVDTPGCVVVLEGLQPDPLLAPDGALALLWQPVLVRMALAQDADFTHLTGSDGVAEHRARDSEDEAQRAAACVLHHVAQGHVPVALVATDRVITRRVRAMLDGAGLPVRDESGWKLSTTRSAGRVVGLLRAAARGASCDEVLAWVKDTPLVAPGDLVALEQALRKSGQRDWARWVYRAQGGGIQPGAATATAQIEAVRQGVPSGRLPLDAWLGSLRAALQAGGVWEPLVADTAGASVVAALRLDTGAQQTLVAGLQDAGSGARRMDLPEFSAWADAVLEAGIYAPPQASRAEVVILPMSQLLARPFGAVVLPGCDEVRLPAAPEPPGEWTQAQRVALGLPTRATLQQATRAAWLQALQFPQVDILWRQSDPGGEPLLPSPLVQEFLLQAGRRVEAQDPRRPRAVAAAPTPRPAPQCQSLPVTRLSASAYEDLRRCPYRFFALRQLGLKESDELQDVVDKRDFGLWLHAVLKAFHEGRDGTIRPRDAIDQAADTVTQDMGLSAAAFLPFAAAWPAVRDGYLEWLAGHEAAGARFVWAEQWQELPLGDITLIGQIDRLDTGADGVPLVLDYKTESPQKTRDRVKHPTEDTQLAFYAALQPDDTVRAAYINIGEREGTLPVEQHDVVAVRDALIEGILHDMRRIREGAPLPALGEGAVCDYCAARGLCRRDSWSDPA